MGLLFGSIIGFFIGRSYVKRRQLAKALDGTPAEHAVASAKAKDQDLADSASTATPETMDHEVQTEVSGELVAEQTETFSATDEGHPSPPQEQGHTVEAPMHTGTIS